MINLRIFFRDRSFAYKFTLLTTIPVIATAVSIAFLATRTLESSITEATNIRVKRNTYLAAISMSNPYVIYNKALLDSFVDSLRREKGIIYAFVVDYNDGRILAHSDHTKDGQFFKKKGAAKIQISGNGMDGISELPGIGYEAVSPLQIGNELFGTVRVGYTLAAVYKQISLLRMKIAGITFLAIVFSILLSIFLARLLSQPILALAAQAQNVAEGYFEQRITYTSKDVVGRLASAFKRMTGELKDRLNQIESNEAKYRALFEAANDAVLILNQDRIVDCNRQTLEMFKGRSEDILLKPFNHFSPEKQPNGEFSDYIFKNRIEEVLSGRRHRFYWKLICSDLTELDAEVSLSPTVISGQAMVLAVVQDITERKAAESEIENFNRTLEERVEERTRELEAAQEAMLNLVEDLNESKKELETTNIALRKSEKEAEAANRAKGEFLANMSHEIRTPLNAVVGLTYLTKQTELTPQQYDYLMKIDSAADSLLSVINDILDFSKIEAGKLTMESVEFYLEDVLNKVADMVSIKADEKSLEFIIAAESGTPEELVGDPLRLGQVLVNLATNAVKFTEKGEVVIQAKLVENRKDTVLLKFEVRDTGIGLSGEDREKLFKAFSQADTSTTRKFGGTGLGLVICQRIVAMMGGKIELASELGKGSTFSFTVLLGRHNKKRTLPMMFAEDFENLQALVVDDSRTARQTLKKILESLKLKVTLAASGQEALALLKKHTAEGNKFDMVFTDLKMPLMDGIEMSRQIKNNQTLPQIPIIIMVTAFGKDKVIRQAQQIGLDGFITKPVSASTILDSIMTAFGKKTDNRMGERFNPLKLNRGLMRIAGSKILVAEDNEINQQVAFELLSSVGVTVTIVNNGKKAVEQLRADQYDAVLMDVQMPVMDGLTAAEQIRALNSDVARIPIIALTAHAMIGDREKSIRAGMNDHITKPLDPEELFKVLVKWIKPRENADADILDSYNDPPDQTQAEIPLPELSGIDIPATLARLGGNRAALIRLIIKFCQGHLEDVHHIAEYLKSGKHQKALEATHTLKGVSGTIGAVALQQASQRLEAAIKDERIEMYDSLLDLMEELLNHVLDSGRQLEKNAEINKASTSGKEARLNVDKEKVDKALSALKKLLQNNSFNTGKQMETIEQLLQGSRVQAELHQLKKLVGRYRFKEAQNALDQLKAELNDNPTLSKDQSDES